MELTRYTAVEIIAHLRKKTFSAQELVQQHLDQIARVEPRLHAWVYLDPALALKQAAAVDRELNAGKGRALAGVPIGVKDIFNTIDMPTQMGSPIWKGFTPGNDARVIHYLREADAVLLGKTVTAEFAVHAPGPTLNPHHPDHMPGTSSSGSAAAVAAYMAPLALGTQTAGSTIRPASYCGIYGFKPSFGLIPRTGMLKTTDSLDTVAFFARAVEDLALLFEVIRVHGLDFPISHQALNDPARRDKGDRPWRIALVRGPKAAYAEDYAIEALNTFAGQLARTPGIEVREIEIPENFDRAHAVHATIYDRTLAYYFKEEFKQHTLVSPIMYSIVERGNQLSLSDYSAAIEQQQMLSRQMDDFFVENCDVILNLSTGGEAPKGLDSSDRLDNCLIWTLCGLPAINLPVFTGPHGLPFGAQIVGRRYNDYLLLKFAEDLQRQGIIGVAPNPMPRLLLS